MLGFVKWEADGVEPIMVLNYCPFCGTPLEKGKPTCGGLVGVRKETERDVPE